MSGKYIILNTPKMHYIVEQSTQQTINSFRTIKEAKKYITFLNRGGFFDGWTPAFFLKNVTKNAY